ncbi:MAG TPA: flagellar biosynthesis protein FlhF [Acidobacteriota bacterium]|nr:flagellar biosynthesis protein FlhF [Acidobacteriota bacterium]
MRIKTFYAKTMAEALQEIKSSLGPDALLLSTKEIKGRSGAGRSSTGFEVVAATDGHQDQDLSLAVEDNPDTPGELEKGLIPVPGGTADPGPVTYSPASVLKNHAAFPAVPAPAKKSRSKKGAAERNGEAELPPSSALSLNLYKELTERGVHDWLAARLVNDAFAKLSPKQRTNRPAMMRSMTAAVQMLISESQSEDGLPAKKIVAFIGPTGVGKTTSIAKLAARLALRNRKKIVLMTLDAHRIGAIEQLKTYAGLMGIPFRFVREVSELAKAIQDHTQRDYILIDTAGRGPREWVALHDLASFLSESSEIERHLVLSATTKPSDLKDIVDRFEICKPDHLIFTKVDETTTLGPILNELVRTRKPLSYYTDGQKVPEDLHVVSRDRIIDLVLNLN